MGLAGKLLGVCGMEAGIILWGESARYVSTLVLEKGSILGLLSTIDVKYKAAEQYSPVAPAAMPNRQGRSLYTSG